MYIYEGRSFRTLIELSEYTGISKATLSRKFKESKETGISLDLLIRDIQNKVKTLENELKEINRVSMLVFGRTFTSINKLNEYLKEFGYLGEPSDGSYTLVDYLNVIHYAKKHGYVWLVSRRSKTKSIEYNGVLYRSLTHFLSGLRIIKGTLYKNIIKCKGDLRRAILISENDPDFREIVKPIINGVKYANVEEAGRVLRFSTPLFKTKLREGYSFDEAYEYSKHLKEYSGLSYFPCVINGIEFKNLSSFAQYCDKSRSTIRLELSKGMTPEEVCNKFKRQPILTVDDKDYYTLSELAHLFDMGRVGFTTIIHGNGGLENWWRRTSKDRFVIDGYILYTSSNLHKYLNIKGINLHRRGTTAIWREMTKVTNPKEKLEVLTREINLRLKIGKWFYDGRLDFTISDILSFLKEDKNRLYRLVLSSSTKEELMEKIDR